MQHKTYKELIEAQRRFFLTGATLPVAFRIEQLKKLKSLIIKHQNDITHALKQDLHKAPEESILSEIVVVNKEIDYIIKNLKSWVRPEKVGSPFPLFFPGRSKIQYDPYGTVLIIGPWNYPFLLMMSPLVGAMCAGNCVILKPSEITQYTQDVIQKLINDNFPSDYLKVITADPAQMPELLQEKFDYIFFTGSTHIGRIIMSAAAQHLTPVTLELGNKSPCIVDSSADLDFAARRIVWGKFLNAGQTCIAPDYLFVHHTCKQTLIEKLTKTIANFYGNDPEKSPGYGRIINKHHFDRLRELMRDGRILYGGQANENDLYIAPTLIDDVQWNQSIMQEEIFGPLLPIITFDSIEEVITTINSKPEPLALYLFAHNKQMEDTILHRVSFGGSCVNDCLLQIANYHLPFGGVGTSGIGSYHGIYSFKTFSHPKSIFKKLGSFDLKLEYPPFTKQKFFWLKKLLRI